ncbi:MAG: hypothetical protein CMJ83_10460 [Planctomycetes bacterium]|nr:hypothetical protein [Planctomycetota bacterium]
MPRILLALALVLSTGLTSCSDDPPAVKEEPDYLVFQGLVVSFKDAAGFGGQAPGAAADRDQAGAKKLAEELLQRIKNGEGLSRLEQQYSAAAAKGPHSMRNYGVVRRPKDQERGVGWESAMCDVLFQMDEGDVQLVEYEPERCRRGYWIVSRLQDLSNRDDLLPAPATNWQAKGLEKEADKIVVQHVLIGFDGTQNQGPGAEKIGRDLDQARVLSRRVLAGMRSGMSIGALVKGFSSDPGGGVYSLVNEGVTGAPDEYVRRDGMVKGFSDLCFSLAVGECAIAAYDKETSPYGFHVIKRLE